MRVWLTCISAAVLFSATLASALARADLGHWFYTATGLEASMDGTAMKRPDFLPGTSWKTMHCDGRGVAIGNGIWQLVKFDRTHGIGLAMATTDQCSVALFKASSPGVSVPNADLTGMSTARGIHIGSTYQSVLSTYGGKSAKRGRHFLVAYTSAVPDTTLGSPHKAITLPQTITLVVDNGRVSAITITVDEGGMF